LYAGLFLKNAEHVILKNIMQIYENKVVNIIYNIISDGVNGTVPIAVAGDRTMVLPPSSAPINHH
jgi:hypothetical protein